MCVSGVRLTCDIFLLFVTCSLASCRTATGCCGCTLANFFKIFYFENFLELRCCLLSQIKVQLLSRPAKVLFLRRWLFVMQSSSLEHKLMVGYIFLQDGGEHDLWFCQAAKCLDLDHQSRPRSLHYHHHVFM